LRISALSTESEWQPVARPTVAVITTNYNHARYLPESIGAVLAQTRIPDEYLLIDDASTDGSRAVMASLTAGRPWIRILHNDRNLGVIPSANRALAETSCDYVFFLSADDRLAPAFIERSLSLLERHPSAAICSALTDAIDVDGRPLGVFGSAVVASADSWLSPRDAREALLRYGVWVWGNTTVIRRDALIELGGLRAELGSRADGALHVLLPLRYGACFIPAPLASFRVVQDSYSQHERRDPVQYQRVEQQLLALLRAAGEIVPAEYIQNRQRLLSLQTAYDAALLREAGILFGGSSRPLTTLGRRLRTDLTLLGLLWRYRAAWWADRQRTRRVRATLGRAGIRPEDTYS